MCMKPSRRQWRPILFVTALLFFSVSGRPAPAADPTQAALEIVVREEMSAMDIPGLSLAIAIDGDLWWTKGFDYSDLENEVPATAATMYRLASISKAITAVAALQLHERGELDLDADVRRYVPAFPTKKWPLTARHLLGHLGGIRHYKAEEFASTRPYTNLAESLKIFKNDPLVAEPGTEFHYTTHGFSLLGAIIEAASGQAFLDYCRRNIFEPAGMRTIQDDNTFRLIAHRSRGYQRTADGQILNCGLADTSYKIPGGGMISTASDLARFALALRQGRLLKPETVELMWTRQTLRSGKQTRYGLGWSIEKVDDATVVGHGGGQQGTATILAIARDTGEIIAVMSNLEGSNVRRLSRRLLSTLAGHATAANRAPGQR